MYSPRYGNLKKLAAKTDGDCHLCHEPARLEFYGPTGMFGEDTVTVDHVVPQRYGGDDDPDNLFIAHGVCNSRRGTRDVEEVRFELAGTVDAPMSSDDKTALSVAGGTLVALMAGCAFARPTETGKPQFNGEAALLAGLLGGAFLRSIV